MTKFIFRRGLFYLLTSSLQMRPDDIISSVNRISLVMRTASPPPKSYIHSKLVPWLAAKQPKRSRPRRLYPYPPMSPSLTSASIIQPNGLVPTTVSPSLRHWRQGCRRRDSQFEGVGGEGMRYNCLHLVGGYGSGSCGWGYG
ncbi:hypothetical protein ACFX2F_019643 [Malus domestica]